MILPRYSAPVAFVALSTLAVLPLFADSPSDKPAESVSTELFSLPEGVEVTLWARSPLFYNPTNMDIDRDGRVWVAEGVRYRGHHDKQPEGDRIMVLEDTDGDGTADKSHQFVQEPGLVAPLGVAVIDNKIVVSQPPELIVYHDNDRDLVFDESKGDVRETLLTGFSGINHDHSLHSVTVGPDGKWYFNSGNCGGMFTDKSGKTFISYGSYRPKVIGPFEFPHDSAEYAGQPSDDGHTYVGGFTVRMNPDGTDAEIIGHNYRNSYEQSISSLGDVFQNDNDDPPACRVSWIMEYANFGFSSNDGQRSWRADQRPGQTTQVAEWRQENPGIAPAGDVYGGGSPTGNVFYENGALGEAYNGTFFSCEPGRNVIFQYQPELEGAGFKLERHDFVTTNTTGEFFGSDFIGGKDNLSNEEPILFRPSDISIGPDGALYVSDWYDARVGGHQALDETFSGAIYRIAPKGFKSEVPQIDLSTTDGQILALKSPAPNVRNLGFAALKAQGPAALDAVAALLEDDNKFIRGRAIHLLYQMGISGGRKAGYPQEQTDPEMKIAAYRAMRRAGLDYIGSAIALASDPNPAVRREVALSMRNQPFDIARDILVEIAQHYDGEDRSYLEAFGTGASKKEAAIYDAVKKAMNQEDPLRWSNEFGDIAWRLHTDSAVPDLISRAKASALPADAREQAVDTLAFVPSKAAADGMIEIAKVDGPAKDNAFWWLLNRANNDWSDHGVMAAMSEAGIYDPKNIVIQEVGTPDPAGMELPEITVEQVLALQGDPAKGKLTAMRCVMCHEIDGNGVQFGPPLDGWGRGQTLEVIARSMVDPSADISHGFDGTEIKTKDGKMVNGLLIGQGNPLMITSMGGVTQLIPAGRVEKKWKMKRSLMMSASQLGFTAQDVADVAAYLKQQELPK